MDLRDKFNDALENLIASGKIEDTIQASVQKCVLSAIQDATSAYSPFGKQIAKKVAESLAVHGDIDLPSYNDALLKIVARQVQTLTEATIEKQVAERLKDLLVPAPEEIKLSELVAQYREYVKDQKEHGVIFGESRIHLEVEGTGPGAGYSTVYLNPKRCHSRYDCAIQIHVGNNGRIWSLKLRDKDCAKDIFAGPFFGVEKMLFQMKAAGSRIVFDCPVGEIGTEYDSDDE